MGAKDKSILYRYKTRLVMQLIFTFVSDTVVVFGNCSSLQQITTPVNGEVLITSHLYGGSAKYKCNDGFTLVGGGIRNCTEGESTVKWSGSQPQCLNSELAFVNLFQLSPTLKALRTFLSEPENKEVYNNLT